MGIIESYLKGSGNLPETVEGLAKKVNDLTAEMQFPPLSGDEIARLAARFCRPPEEHPDPPAGGSLPPGTGNAVTVPRKPRKLAGQSDVR